MKSLILAVLFLMSTTSWAQFHGKPMGNVQDLRPIDGIIMDVQTKEFPQEKMMTEVSMRFFLIGCLDTLAPVSYQIHEREDGKVRLEIAAYNMVNEESYDVHCFVPPYVDVQLYLEGERTEEDIILDFRSLDED